MNYISTRGEAPTTTLTTTLLNGLAPDGGLYLPQTLPKFETATLTNLIGQPYEIVAETVLKPFFSSVLSETTLCNIIQKSYHAFRLKERLTLHPLGNSNIYTAELFHGPTYAFKDFALQFLGRVLEHILTEQQKSFTVLGATSGDTGSAAIAAFKDIANGRIVILHPHERTSLLQRKQMTTTGSSHVINLAIKGNFDDCQHLVKACFNDSEWKKTLGGELIAVNSINWVRILAQTVYYFFSYLEFIRLYSPLKKATSLLPSLVFSVPTGNFGDVFAGYLAKRMGLPIKKLIVATNENDVLHRFFSDNHYTKQPLQKTYSPSMDIALASNFERLLYYALNSHSEQVKQLLEDFQKTGSLSLDSSSYAEIQKHFLSTTTTNAETLATIENTYANHQYLTDPHTAVGVHGALQYHSLHSNQKVSSETDNIIVLSTAHPVKFREAITAVNFSKIEPPPPLKELDYLNARKEVFTVIPNDLKALKQALVS